MIKAGKRITGSILILIVIILCIKPQDTITGGTIGLNICLKTIIPSLFPFMFLINMLLNGEYLSFGNSKFKNILIIYFLSIVGGYPIGAKLCDEIYKNGIIDIKSARYLVCFCTHSGPGFIILSTGVAIFGNSIIGFILMAAHIISSAIIGLFFIKRIDFKGNIKKLNKISFSNNLVISAEKTSGAIINICAFIILFSVIEYFIKAYLSNIVLFKYLGMILEVSNGINNSKNIYFISFLLGFGGFCVWAQIVSCFKNAKINLLTFSLSRIVHGALSSLVTYILINAFKIKIKTSNIIPDYSFLNSYSRFNLSVSLIIMFIVLLCYSTKENRGGNLFEDIV